MEAQHQLEMPYRGFLWGLCHGHDFPIANCFCFCNLPLRNTGHISVIYEESGVPLLAPACPSSSVFDLLSRYYLNDVQQYQAYNKLAWP